MMDKCPICKEYLYAPLRHKCEPMWYCINADESDELPSIEYMLDDGKKTFASDARDAALKFAEYYQGYNSHYPDEMSVMVMDAAMTTITKYKVNQQAVPSYWIDAEPEIMTAQHEDTTETVDRNYRNR